MTIRYPLRQSTDEDAFEPIPSRPLFIRPVMKDKTHHQKANSGVLDKKATRKAALEALAIRIEDKSGAGKLKGKVGIVTGVGPPNGIGVSLYFTTEDYRLNADCDCSFDGSRRCQESLSTRL